MSKKQKKQKNVVPNPGSDAAIKIGCTCPVYDNAHGAGSGYKGKKGEPLFWNNGDCPVHNKSIK